jgi:SAM-dependent methyltransferase
VREPTAPVYYDRRAVEYDDWYRGVGAFADRIRPGFPEELGFVCEILASLEPQRTLDVACGTGFLTRHLPGTVTGLDQSKRMLAVAASQAPHATLVQGDGLELPFGDDSFERVVSGHFYGHLDDDQRQRFLAESRRVAQELVIVDASREHSPVGEEWAHRVLNDGTTWEVYKRYFTPEELLAELGGGEILLAGAWFLVVRSGCPLRAAPLATRSHRIAACQLDRCSTKRGRSTRSSS